MNRDQFMKQLENLLFDLPADEREEALRYYQDYFDDAGQSEESRIIEELGTPEKVAKFIKGNVYNKSTSEAGEYTEKGYRNPYEDEKSDANAVNKYGEQQENQANETNGSNTSYEQQQPPKDNTKVALIVVIAILTCPLWIGAIGATLGICMGIIGALFGITVGFGASSIGLFIGAVVLIVVGIGQLFSVAPTGVVMIGCGFVLLALALLFMFVTIQVVTKLIPAIIRGITSIFNKLFHKDRRVMA